MSGEAPQFSIDQRDQFGQRILVAASDPGQQDRYLSRWASHRHLTRDFSSLFLFGYKVWPHFQTFRRYWPGTQ
jgi:hypothetical protein